MSEPTVGVLGATGYVGGAVVRDLRERGVDVRPAAGSSHDSWPAVDVRNRAAVRSFVESVDVCVNAAGLVGIGACDDRPETALEINGTGAATVAQACARDDVPLVHLSTVATIGIPDEQPITAATDRKPTTTYGRTKLVGEQAVRSLTDGRVPSITYCVTNVFGTVGDDDSDGGSSVLDYFVDRAAAGERLTVHRPGTQALDLIHVRDVAAAIGDAVTDLTAATTTAATTAAATSTDPDAQTYVLGSGESYSVLELAGLVAHEYRESTGDVLGIELCDRPDSEPPPIERFDVDTEPLRRDLGVEPTRSVEDWISGELAGRLDEARADSETELEA